MLITAYILSGIIGVAIFVLGAHDLLAPKSAATGFGLPNEATGSPATRAWLSVRAVRDIASGLFIFILLVNAKPHVLGWIMLAACLIPLGDAIVVRRNNGPKAAVYGIHGGTTALMVVISVLLLIA